MKDFSIPLYKIIDLDKLKEISKGYDISEESLKELKITFYHR